MKYVRDKKIVCHAPLPYTKLVSRHSLPIKSQKAEILAPESFGQLDTPQTQNFYIYNPKDIPYMFWLRFGKWKFYSINFIVEQIYWNFSSSIWAKKQNYILRNLKFDKLRVAPIQISTKKGSNLSFVKQISP
jgi:hypothetical protein